MLFAVELFVTAVLLLLFYFRRPRGIAKKTKNWPGPAPLPILGNVLDLGTNKEDYYYKLEGICKQSYGSACRIWLGNEMFALLSSPKDLEIVLGSNKLIEKSFFYNFLHSWLGTGLLTSRDSKWHKHRKILTPSFHFKILEQFISVFHNNGKILVDCLRDQVDGPGFDVHNFLTLNALDNICESALGLKVNAQQDINSEYVQAVRQMSDIMMKRTFKPWLQPDFVFNLTSLKRKETKALKILHGTTNEMIKTRREEMKKEWAAKGETGLSISEDGTKRRLAFLDLLIESTYNGSNLSDLDIREEVDTFMFEGHDTTAAGITFALWLLAWHPDVQESVVEELEEVWPDPALPPSLNKLQELKCLERVIKETLRLFPSVPVFGRKVAEDTVLSNGLVLPEGATIAIMAFMTHKDPGVFPDPEKFDPDRFLPENVQGRHPYAFIPFSAGPRNCIGQKFAMLEMKMTLSQVLRCYRLLPGDNVAKLKLVIDVILKVPKGVFLKLQNR